MSKIPHLGLDPGHGGADPGAVGRFPWGTLLEKDTNLRLALALREALLTGWEVKVTMSRTTDVFISLRERTELFNAAKVDFMFSLHSNGHSDAAAQGFDTFIFTVPSAGSIKGQDEFHPRAAKVWTDTGRRDRGKKRANFHMLRESRMPSLLVENGFTTNTVDARLLNDSKHQELLVAAMAEGLAAGMGLKRKVKHEKPAPPVAGTIYRVQSGAFRVKGNADNLESRLKKAGYETYMVKDGDLYKVQTGAFGNKENAERLAASLRRDGFEAYITTKAGTPVASIPQTSQPTPTPTIRVGSRVRVKQGAKDYNGRTLASFVYNTIYAVLQVNGDRVVIGLSNGQITAAVHRNNLILV